MIKKLLIFIVAVHSLSVYGMQIKSSLPGLMRSYPTVKDEVVEGRIIAPVGKLVKNNDLFCEDGHLCSKFSGQGVGLANRVVKDQRNNIFEHGDTTNPGSPQICRNPSHVATSNDEEFVKKRHLREQVSYGSFCTKTVEEYYQEKINSCGSSVKKAFLKLDCYFQHHCFLGNVCYFGFSLASLIAAGMAARFYVQKKQKNAKPELAEACVKGEKENEMKEPEAEGVLS